VGTGPLKVLVADDDDDLRALVVEMLQARGVSTCEAHDGAELIDMLDRALDDPSQRPDLLLTDVLMPNLSGLGVLQALRRAQWRLPVVVMTGLTDESVETVALRLGAVRVLHKPIDVDEMMAAVRSAGPRPAR